ncbi:MAG TPA: tetratricopeptide repeat protein [bacterium]|nr:tetratricopeptide repeat protein [bacterium]
MRKTFGILLLVLGIGFSSCAHKTSENFYFGNYSEAEALYNRGEYEKAIQRYQAYVDENPEGNLALISQYYIARSKMALGRIDEAKSLFQKIVTEHRDTVWANFSESQLKDLEKIQKK